MAFAESSNQGTQPYKYNGKELDQDQGLNWYDYEARYLTNDVPRFTTMDPHSENYYSWSPYYCASTKTKRELKQGSKKMNAEDSRPKKRNLISKYILKPPA